MVKIYWTFTGADGEAYDSWCSGTMITQGLVLTAGHCVYATPEDGQKLLGPNATQGQYYDYTTYTIVPGNEVVNGQNTAPYGVWTVKNMFVDPAYASGSTLGGDWAVIELNPNSTGYAYPGANPSIGTFSATWNQPTIDQLYSMGYPVDGNWGLAAYGSGDNQVFCDDAWAATDNDQTDAQWSGYYAMLVNPCVETGGASGGPVFTDTASGWTVIGVNNRGPGVAANGFGTEMISFYFDNNFGAFWNSVINLVDEGY